MFYEQFGDVFISEATTPQSGAVLSAFYQPTNTTIYMNVNSEAVPDGVDTYLIGNKVICTIHWEDISDDDEEATMEEGLKFRCGMIETGLLFLSKHGTYRWGYHVLYPGLLQKMNDLSKPFDEMIILLVESSDATVKQVRRIKLPNEIGIFIAKGNLNSIDFWAKNTANIPGFSSMRAMFDKWDELAEPLNTKYYQSDLNYLSGVQGMYGFDLSEDGDIELFGLNK